MLVVVQHLSILVAVCSSAITLVPVRQDALRLTAMLCCTSQQLAVLLVVAAVL
jgi:hypothetical protein